MLCILNSDKKTKPFFFSFPLPPGGHRAASFSSVSSGALPPFTVLHSDDLLARVASLAAPGASVEVAEAVGGAKGLLRAAPAALADSLKLAGLTGLGEPEEVRTLGPF